MGVLYKKLKMLQLKKIQPNKEIWTMISVKSRRFEYIAQ